jgi:hypothetical protein
MPSCGAFPTARPRGRAGSPRRSATNFSTMGSTSLTVAFRTGVTAEARAGLSEWMPSLMRTCPTGSEPTRTPCHDGPHRRLYGPQATRGALQRVEHSHQQTAASPQAAPTSPSRLGAEIDPLHGFCLVGPGVFCRAWLSGMNDKTRPGS